MRQPRDVRRSGLAILAVLTVAACGDMSDGSSVDTTDTTPTTDLEVAAADVVAAVDASTTDEIAPPPITWCEGGTRYAYDPTAPGLRMALPDDHFTVDDAGSLTGVRIRVDEANAPWLADIYQVAARAFRNLNELDGWGTTAGIILPFSGPLGPLPSGEAESLSSDALMLWELPVDGPPRRIPFELQLTDHGATAILWPMLPLTPKTLHGVLMTTVATDESGECISPAAKQRRLLDGSAEAPELARLAPRYQALLAAAGVEPGEVSAASVFTTQSITETSEAIATDIESRSYQWSAAPACVEHKLYRECDGAFVTWDWRSDGVIEGIEPVLQQELFVRLWLPREHPPPWPTLVFGHGLNSGRGQGDNVAEFAAPLGVMTVAIDATHHNEYPGAAEDSLQSLMSFFGIDLTDLTLWPLELRDNWRQSTYDKLQLLQLLLQQPDVDGDGVGDVDEAHLGYLGASLGGIMGAELLALSDRLGVGVLSVPGGRVASIISDAEMFYALILLLKPQEASDGDVDRFFPILQTLLEAGDASNYAPHVLRNRLPVGGPAPPSLLMVMAIGDTIVPNVCQRSLARGLDLPHLAPILQEIGIVDVIEAGPVSGNIAPGTPEGVTAALCQYEWITKHPGEEPIKADHDNVSTSVEVVELLTHFLQSWRDTGLPEIARPDGP